MENVTDAMKLGAIIIITAIAISLAVFFVNKGVKYFNAQSSTVNEVAHKVKDTTGKFDNKVMTGEDVIIGYQQYGDRYVFMIQTCWMQRNGVNAYQYGGDDPIVSKEMYCDTGSQYYFSKEANYTSTLIERDEEIVGFMFVQMEG